MAEFCSNLDLGRLGIRGWCCASFNDRRSVDDMALPVTSHDFGLSPPLTSINCWRPNRAEKDELLFRPSADLCFGAAAGDCTPHDPDPDPEKPWDRRSSSLSNKYGVCELQVKDIARVQFSQLPGIKHHIHAFTGTQASGHEALRGVTDYSWRQTKSTETKVDCYCSQQRLSLAESQIRAPKLARPR